MVVSKRIGPAIYTQAKPVSHQPHRLPPSMKRETKRNKGLTRGPGKAGPVRAEYHVTAMDIPPAALPSLLPSYLS